MSQRVYNLIILDESGSMSIIEKQTISGFNETIQTISAAQRKHEGQRHLNDYFPYSPIREHQLPSGREIRGFHCLNVNFSRPEQKERLVQKQIQMPGEWEPGEKK